MSLLRFWCVGFIAIRTCAARRLPSFEFVDQINQVCVFLGLFYERKLEQFFGRWTLVQKETNFTRIHTKFALFTHIIRVFVKTCFHKFFERLWIRTCELGRIVFRNEKKDSHGMKITVGRLALGQFYCCDAERPYVSFCIICRLFYYFWCHPKGCANECRPLAARSR